jgi:hypothetical protein
MESLITSMALSGDMSKTKVTTIDGKRVIGISGPLPAADATVTMYVALDGPPLVVRYTIKGTQGSANVELSDWGKHFKVEVPPNAVAARDIT